MELLWQGPRTDGQVSQGNLVRQLGRNKLNGVKRSEMSRQLGWHGLSSRARRELSRGMT